MPPPGKPTMKPLSSSLPEGGAPPSNNLWIGNLSPEVRDSELMSLFEKHGPVDSITNYSSRSYAFVYYKKIEDAKAAKEKIQGTILHGNAVKIEFAKPVRVHLINSCQTDLAYWESVILNFMSGWLFNEFDELRFCIIRFFFFFFWWF